MTRNRFVLGALVFCGGLVIAGMIYERIGEWRDRKALPQIGRSYDIGGRRLNLYCSGEGSPTVIFESNGGIPGFRWVRLQREVASFTRACWYDRAGLGWSDPGPFPNHSDSIAHDLHDLLAAAKIGSPYILVGHAIGGFDVRVFRSFFPDVVAGLVLVDPTNEDMSVHIHNHNELYRPMVMFILGTLSRVGLLRLLQGEPGPPQHGWDQHEWNTLIRLSRSRKARLAAAQELPIWVNGELARAGSCYGKMPMIVLSAGIQDQEEDPKLDHNHGWKMQLHERLAHLSSAGEHVIVPSGHDIPDEAPEAVVAAIKKVTQEAKDAMQVASR
ncbi:MAG TPA: alpha/beta hydrolase [Terriglobales bacterium]|nr:alpha/beta hydrolase [Terriglobales bacterium]